MAVRYKLETKGMEEFMDQLVKLGLDVDDAAAEALDAGADVLVEGMQQRAPKDTHNLEQHIGKSEPQRDGNFHFILVGVLKPDANLARYAAAQEFGWAERTGTKAARAYIRNTIDEDMRKARVRMRDAFKARIQS